MKTKAESWEERRTRETAEFVDRWTWESVFQTYKMQLQDYHIDLGSVFHTVRMHDPAAPTGRESEVTWWPTDSIRVNQINSQRHFERFPGTLGPTHSDSNMASAGQRAGIGYLWENKGDPELLAAILIAGSLFPRLESARSRYPEKWPMRAGVQKLAEIAYFRWLGPKQQSAWHYSCTAIWPYKSEDWVYTLDSMFAMVRYLAEEHAALLHCFKPVVIEFGNQRDPFVVHALDHEKELERERSKKYENRMAQEKAIESERLAALKLKHPRHGEWASINVDELERLVWSETTSKLGQDFGVTDVAIGKRCKALGISKPPTGFWTKVASGKIPHPEGKPSTQRISAAKVTKLEIVS